MITSDHIPVGTTAELLVGTSDDDSIRGISAAVKNAGAASIFLGPDDVTTATGYELAAGGELGIDLAPGEELYGIVATGTQAAQVLRAGVSA
jgi:hypothetical protein